MLVNIILMAVLFGLIILIAKEDKRLLQKFFNQNRTYFDDSQSKVYNFWRKFFKSWVRGLAVAIILVFQRDVWMLLITGVLTLGVSYLVLRKSNATATWSESKNKSADLIALAVALIWLFDKGVNLLTSVLAAVLIIAWLISRIPVKKENNNVIDINDFIDE